VADLQQGKVLPELPPDDFDLVLGVLYFLRSIRNQTAHGSINLNIVDGKLAEMDVEHRVRPGISAPWRGKKPG
jgi:hypothetical protein